MGIFLYTKGMGYYQDKWYRENKEKKKAYFKEWYARNKEKHLENCRQYKIANRDELRIRRAVDNSTQKQHKSMV